jgi:RNA polymerase sigma-70 factor, ECF subfamily
MSDTTDTRLVERILSGDRSAFADLLDEYQTVVYNVALGIVSGKQDAEDVTQTVFLKVYENLATYNPKYRLFSWIYRITINEAINARKRMRPGVELNDETIPDNSSASRMAVDADREDRIGAALMFLSPENRAIVLLRHYQEFSYSEIGYVMDLSSEKVKSRLYSARKQLGRILIKSGLRAQL